MNRVELIKTETVGSLFKEHLSNEIPDEYYFRNKQVQKKNWRAVTEKEKIILKENGNIIENYDTFFVSDVFDPNLIRRSNFYGLVRIGAISSENLRFHDLELPQGIVNSTIINCDIGDNCAIHNCAYISHYIIEDRVILHNNDEMQSTNHAKFGVGIIKEGEDEDVRVKISIMNEAEGRAVHPFVDMTLADAWLWGSYRGDLAFMNKLDQFTKDTMDFRRGYYGTIGQECVIKSTKTIKDVNFGHCAYVKGANKLKNLTIKSSELMATQIGEGVEMVNGIVGQGCHIFYGCKAVRFVMMDMSNLKYGARLINSILGENSTVSCCELLNNLVFAGHEQHHNNSFLIASNIQGLSNMAAGANIGSNHNSRGADGEIVAERGFWPALSSTLKHNCKFASYTLIAKGNYPVELNLKFPFALLSCENDQRLVMPAYWWMYNLYALERNSYKVKARDKRKVINQIVNSAYLAPDTALEILEARKTLRYLVAKAWLKDRKDEASYSTEEMIQQLGQDLLHGDHLLVDSLEVVSYDIENSNKPVIISKSYNAYQAYGEMLIYYGARTIAEWVEKTGMSLREIQKEVPSSLQSWTNLGGQLVPERKIDNMRRDVASGKIKSWDEMHSLYKQWGDEFEKDQLSNALGILKKLLKIDEINDIDWTVIKNRARKTRILIENQVFETKVKDYNNPYRDITFRDNAERDIVLGAVEENPFITESSNITKKLLDELEAVRY
jgi:NDP-sugar pyrophosphorylase family protein